MSPVAKHVHYYALFIITIIIQTCHSQNVTTTNTPTNNIPDTTFMTTPALTVSDSLVTILSSISGLNISAKYCTWNVSQIIQGINNTDPAALYSDTYKQLLPTVLPEYVQRQLPQSLIEFYELNFTGPATEECGGGPVPAPPEIDLCVGPLIHSDLYNAVNDEAEQERLNVSVVPGVNVFINVSLSGCGLACSAAPDVYGLTDDEQNVIDLCKIIGCVISFIANCVLAVFQVLEQRRSKKNFCSKPLLQMIPYIITLSGFGFVVLMCIGEVIGKDMIVCSSSEYRSEFYPDDEEKEFSFYNPIHGKSIGCTFHGILFYSMLQIYAYYICLLSFVVFRQLYAPMAPLWRIKQRWWHIGVLAIIAAMDIAAAIESTYSGVYPMGVCFPGAGQKIKLLFMVNIPLTLSCTLSFVLLCFAAVLLRKELAKQKSVVNKDSTTKIRDLYARLIFYAIGVVATLLLITVTSYKFYVESDNLSQGMEKSIECQISQILLQENLDIDCNELRKDAKVAPFYFISWVVAVLLAVTAQLILSCHNEARHRLREGIESKLKTITSTPRSGTPKSKSVAIDEVTGHELSRTAGGQSVKVDYRTEDGDHEEVTTPRPSAILKVQSISIGPDEEDDAEIREVELVATTSISPPPALDTEDL